MKALIVEDELAGQKLLAKLLKIYCPEVHIVGTVTTVAEAVSAINTLHPDIVFLDIELPQENGMALFNYFDRPPFKVIFTTSHDEFAVEAFKLSAVDYLLKPISGPDLVKAVKKVGAIQHTSNFDAVEQLKFNYEKAYERISIPTLTGYDFYRIREIIRAEAEGRYTAFFLEDGKKILSSNNIGIYETELSNRGFFRIHRSHIINLMYISRYHRGNSSLVEMEDGSILPVSNKKKEDLLNHLNRGF